MEWDVVVGVLVQWELGKGVGCCCGSVSAMGAGERSGMLLWEC